MKRSVAILGPTPPFVRWAIWHPCPLRELDEENLADQTFRQLRAMRELSLGFNDGRVIDGICVHLDASADDIDSAKGFSVEEILGFFGTKDFVDACCLKCPANALATNDPPVWTGCYGWLPSRDFAFAGSRNVLSKSFDLIALVDQVIKDQRLSKQVDSLFEMATPAWFGFWKPKVPNPNQLEFLKLVFEKSLSIARANGERETVLEPLVQFVTALTKCCENGLAIHVEHVPGGNSDGQTWEINQHCPDCKVELGRSVRQTCHVCGRIGTPAAGRKSRVLGTRPLFTSTACWEKRQRRSCLSECSSYRNASANSFPQTLNPLLS